jgi:methyl-accepting chemotaxis protein
MKAAGELGAAVARSEEGLGRIVAATSATGRSMARLKADMNAISEAAARVRLLALNTAIDSTRAGEQGKRIGLNAEEIRMLAEKCAERAGSLAAMVSTAGDSAAQAHRESEETGRALHQATARASALSRLAREATEILQGRVKEDPAPETGTPLLAAEEAALSDRARSALAGLSRIAERIAAIAREEKDLAAKSAVDLKKTIQIASENASDGAKSIFQRG